MTQKNILQIDVEDWYCDLEFDQWASKESRVVETTEKILNLLKETNNKATFFILGYIAEKYPELVRRIEKDGHEIASHGYAHKRIDEQTPEEFEKDIIKSIEVLNFVTHKKINGYRAPQFTVTNNTLWALNILKKNGFEYDSSIFPVKTPLYGIPDSPLYVHNRKIDEKNSLLEVPLSVYNIPVMNKKLPIAGGIYLRMLPYLFIKHAIKKINKSGNPAVLFIHPSDIDSEKPKLKPKKLMDYYKFGEVKDSLRWYHYYGLSDAESKFKRLLKDFKFTSTEEFIKNGAR